MKKLVMLCIVILIVSCDQKPKKALKTESSTETTNVSTDFDWLLGNWQRLNEQEGKVTFESWIKNSETEYLGKAFTLQQNDTIQQEQMKIIKQHGVWSLTVAVPGENESVTFSMDHYNDSEFTFINDEIDFPTKIHYWKTGEKINATIANAEMEIPFEFGKRE